MEVSGRKDWDYNTSTKILCQPCQSDGDTVEAEGFCENCNEFICAPCLKAHRKLTVSKNHVIKLKDEMPKHQIKVGDQCSQLCTVHKTEIVKFYCEDHNSVSCGDCMVLHHKKCSVKLVSDVSDNFDTSQELEQIKKKITALQLELSSHRDAIANEIKDADEMRKSIIREIKIFRQEMNEYLDNTEKDLLKEIDDLRTKQVTQLKHIQGEFETMIDEIKECESKIHQTSDKINDLFVAAKSSQEKIKECQMSAEKLASKCETEILKFVKSDDFVRFLTNKHPFGVINTESRRIQTNNRKSLINAQTRFLKKLTTRDSNDKEICFITGMVVLSRDELLLVDSYNHSIKVLDTKQNKITSRYTTADNPWDITSIDSSTFAVTIMNGEILLLNISNGITKSRSIKVREYCSGIDYRDGVLAVSYISPASVQLLDTKGVVQREFDIEKHCTYPEYIGLSKDTQRFIVSNFFTNGLCEFSADGHLKTKIAGDDVKGPLGFEMTDDGSVIVCCKGISDKLIMRRPGTEKCLSIAVKGVKEPRSMALSDDQNTLFVYDDSAKDIKVFDIM